MTEKTITLAELAETYGRKYDTIFRKAKRIFPAETWGKNSAVTEEVGRMLLGDWPAPAVSIPEKPREQKRIIRTETVTVNQPLPTTPGGEAPPARQGWAMREWILLLLIAAPTAASVRNMYSVTWQLSEYGIDATLLTAVLSISPLGFVLAGVRRWWAVWLTVLLIMFESFCNMTRVYGGLMGVWKNGNPTRFLGLVTDIFNSGSHATAIILGAWGALFLAAVQYAALFELNRKQ